MAKSKSKGRGLGYHTIQRFVVTGCNKQKRVYTSVVDAMAFARRCSRDAAKRPDVLYGLPGAENRIATCAEKKCFTTTGKRILMRKLYEAEQRGPEATVFDETMRQRKRRGGGHVPAKARKKRAKKKRIAPWKKELMARVKARKNA